VATNVGRNQKKVPKATIHRRGARKAHPIAMKAAKMPPERKARR
jgi:hypothetical protein